MASPLDLDLGALPPGVRAFVEAERSTRLALEQEVAELSERNARLEHLVQEFQRALHGKMVGEAECRRAQARLREVAVAEAEAAKTAARPRPRAPASAKRNLGRSATAGSAARRIPSPPGSHGRGRRGR